MNFYQRLKVYRYELKILTHQQYKTIRGQFGSGDREGAERGLERLIAKRMVKKDDHQN